MHDTAMAIGTAFLSAYCKNWRTVVEIGSMDVNGSLRTACPEGVHYLGIDMEHGKSVDLVVRPGDPIPLRDEFCDAVISSSQLEHDDFFWETFLEFVRLVRPGGYVYINAPSAGPYHRYPNDNWRFYPDCGRALARWAVKKGHDVELIESFVAENRKDVWNDFVAVFRVGPESLELPTKLLHTMFPCRHIWKRGSSAPENMSADLVEVVAAK